MTADFEIRGADEVLRLSKALKHAGRGDLRKALNAGIRKAAKPLIAKSKAEAKTRLPQRGGLAAAIARTPQRVQVRTGKDPGVRIVVGGKGGAARGANAGTIRHPVFGNRDVWVSQKVRPGWFEEPMEGGAPEVRRHIEDALNDVAERVVKEAK